MILRSLKWGIALAGGALVLGGLIFGADLYSYVRSSARSVRTVVRDGVPMEFELQRARDMIEDILPELRANVRVIAQEEVEVAHLRGEITDATEKLSLHRKNVAAFRDQLQTRNVSFSVNGRDLSRQQLAERLASSVDRYKQAEATLVSKERLLQTRERSLLAAQDMLERSRSRKAELEQKIEALAAQNRLVQAQAVGTRVSFDNSQLARADKLMTEIQKRLETAQRVLAHEAEFLIDPDTTVVASVDEADLLAEVDSLLERDVDTHLASRVERQASGDGDRQAAGWNGESCYEGAALQDLQVTGAGYEASH